MAQDVGCIPTEATQTWAQVLVLQFGFRPFPNLWKSLVGVLIISASQVWWKFKSRPWISSTKPRPWCPGRAWCLATSLSGSGFLITSFLLLGARGQEEGMNLFPLRDNMPSAQIHFLLEPRLGETSNPGGPSPPPPCLLHPAFYDSNPFKWLETHWVFIMASSLLPSPVKCFVCNNDKQCFPPKIN